MPLCVLAGLSEVVRVLESLPLAVRMRYRSRAPRVKRQPRLADRPRNP